jgi:hypothetical protein
MTTTNGLAPTTTCVHCSEHFDGGAEIIGQPTARLEVLLKKLGSHIQKKHPDPEQAQQLAMYGAALMEMLFLRKNFTSTDPGLIQHRDQMRWNIHQQTLNARFSDESLREQCATLATRLMDEALDIPVTGVTQFQNIVREILFDVFTGMRNDLEEPNKYATPEVAQVVV